MATATRHKKDAAFALFVFGVTAPDIACQVPVTSFDSDSG
jgi:hypothetical protein